MASTISAGTTAGTAIVVSGDTSGSLVLQTNGTTTAVTIDTSQNVGIGTSSPGSKLELSNNSVSVPATYTINNRGTNTTETSTYNLGGTLFGAYRDASSPSYVAGMWAERVSASSGASSSGNLVFGAMTSGTTAYPTEQMRIDSAGLLKFNSGYGSVATAYGCRAWVNFNGTGTVAIRASGNVSSITDNGTGDYTVNFTTALVDANYSVSSSSTTSSGPTALSVTPFWLYGTFTAPTTAAFKVAVQTPVNLGANDATYVMLSVFR